MQTLTKLMAKATHVASILEVMERTRKELNTPKGMLLTVYDHTTPISFSLHGEIASIEFHFLCGKLIPVKSKGATKVEAYIILEQFKQLNSF